MPSSSALAAPYRLLVIGCGNIAGGFDAGRDPALPPLTHAGAFSRDPRCTIAACVDPDEGRREAFMRRWGVRHGYGKVAQALAEGAYDIVSICSPTALHPEHVRATLRSRPRMVFCEKPLAPTLAQARAIVRECKRAGVVLAVNHSRRWAPDVRRLADELRAGHWGAVRSVSGTYNKGVLNNGSHLVDLVQLLLGPMRLIHAGTAIHDHWPDDPSVPAMLESEQGVPAQLVVADARDYAVFELQIITERGVITIEDGGLQWRVRRVIDSPHFRGYRVLDDGERRPGEYLQSAARAADDLLRCLSLGGEPASTGDSALMAQTLCDQMRRRAAPPRACLH
jgi:predicted dehydrogenase